MALSALTLAPINRTQAATFTVDSLTDVAATDAIPGDGFCATGGAVCTLRAAIEEANALVNVPLVTPDSIDFSIAGTITLTAVLPTITEGLTISGATAPGAVVSGGPTEGGSNDVPITVVNTIIINAPNSATDIFVVSVGGCSFTQLAMFTYDTAITLTGVGNFFLISSFFGTDGTGVPSGTQNTAIEVLAGSTFVSIGNTGQGNLFLNHDLEVIDIAGASSDITIEQNTFGTDRTIALDPIIADRNALQSVLITSGTSISIINNRFARSNGASAIEQVSGGGQVIQNNVFGIGIGGVNLGNSQGINMIATSATASVIGTDGDGVNDAAEGNTIVNSTLDGIFLSSGAFANAFEVAGNFIGVTSGNTDAGNGDNGIEVAGTGGGRIGSNQDGTSDLLERNFFANSATYDVSLTGDNWVLRGNDIGLRPDGTSAAPVALSAGVLLGVGPFPGSSSNIIDGNYIGGYSAPAVSGLIIASASANTITNNVLGANRSSLSRPNAVNVGFGTVHAPLTIGGVGAGNSFVSSGGAQVIPSALTSPVSIIGNVFGATPDGTLLPNAVSNLAIEANNITVQQNTFQDPGGGPHITVVVTGPTAQANTITQNSFLSGTGLAIDLANDGVTPDNATYPEAGVANRGIDIAAFNSTDLAQLTGTANPGSTVEVYSTIGPGTGLVGTGFFLNSTIADPSGNFLISLSGLAQKDDWVTLSQTDGGLSDTSEFGAAIQVTKSGGRTFIREVAAPVEKKHPFADLSFKLFIFNMTSDELLKIINKSVSRSTSFIHQAISWHQLLLG